jgi:hypothetical protein
MWVLLQMKYLLAVGGKDVKQLAAGLMRKLFLDDIGEKYSLTGKAGNDRPKKMPFLPTECFRLVHGKLVYSPLAQFKHSISANFLTYS